MNPTLALHDQVEFKNHPVFLEPVMRPVAKDDAFRPSLEEFIRSSYETIFNAKLKGFLPQLVAAYTEDDQIQAAFGYSDADRNSLFLESYIDEPIDALLTRRLNRTVPRSKIVEVGNLSIDRSANSIESMRDIARYLQSLGYEWIVCTATRYLRLLFLKSGAKPITIAQASPKRVNNDGTNWGNYYATRPAILVGHVDRSIHQIEQKLISQQYNADQRAKLIYL